jgi:hypothetical protein
VNRCRRLLALLAVAALSLPVAGCGVPSSGPPVVVKDARRDRGPTGSSKPIDKKTPVGVTDAQELVHRYLQATAWANEAGPDPDSIDKVVDAARDFMTGGAQANWQRGQEITIVRTRFNFPAPTANGTRVEVSMQPIGVLNSRGTIEPKTGSMPQTYPFMVVPAERGNGLRIANPPQGMLLSDEGLGELYDVRPIYFWDTGNRYLVPDVRYVGKSVSPANELVQLTDWLRDGPSEFLRPAVNPLPAGIETKDLPVIDSTSGVVRINLSAKAASVQSQLSRFMTQLKWSLRPRSGALELQIEGQRTNLGAGLANPAATPDGQKDPPRFGIVDGRVRHIGGDSVSVPALNSDDNAGVVSAAILRGSVQQVALVREDGPGRVRLWLGSYNQAAKAAEYAPTDLAAETMSRPAGLTTPALNDPAFLVAAGGQLRAVSVASKQSADRTPPGISGVTAVSVARDTRRVALVAGGRVYAGVLVFDGSSPSVTQLQEVHSELSDATGVAWSREGWLVVTGRLGGRTALVELTIDSGVVEQMALRNLLGLTVARVVAEPVIRLDSDPDRGERGQIMIEANGRAYRVYSGSVDEWPSDPSPAPAPSGSSAKQSPPSAPFFLD